MSNTKQSIASRMDQAFSGSSTNATTKLQKNKAYNQFTGLILHSFAKHSEGKKLTTFEEKLVNCFLESDFSDQDLASISKSYREASTTMRSSILPGKFAQLTTDNDYTFEDLRKDLPLVGKEAIENSQNLGLINTDRVFITKEIIAKAKEHLKTTKDVNAATLEKELDALLPKKQSPKYTKASAELGWSAQVAGRANNFSEVKSTNSGTWDFWAVEMECIDDTGESTRDEPFFGFACTDGTTATKWRSNVFGAISPGDVEPFSKNTLYRNVVQGGMSITIDSWEQDAGDQYDRENQILDKIIEILLDQLTIDSWGDMVQTIIEEITGVGVPPVWYAVFLVCALAIKNFLTNNDDFGGTHKIMIPGNELDRLRKVITVANSNAEDTVTKLCELNPGVPPLLVALLYAVGAYKTAYFYPEMDYTDGHDGHWKLTLRGHPV
ncbi:hypothetical protein K7432_001950 [Basidiobolus ranarum]|uniref:Uncharacterized protein n=1 Tax=Basidiobolus ranarum TaxID=34480 RepID=A0ABR2W8M6_9FUNG